MSNTLIYTGVFLFLVSAYFALRLSAFAAGKSMEACNEVWLNYRDTGPESKSFREAYWDRCKTLKEYLICFCKLVPGSAVVWFCSLYLARVSRWFYTLDAGQCLITAMNHNQLVGNTVIWGVRLLFSLGFVIPLLKADYYAIVFPLQYINDSELFSYKDSRVSEGIIYFVLVMNLLTVLPIYSCYNAMICGPG